MGNKKKGVKNFITIVKKRKTFETFDFSTVFYTFQQILLIWA